MIQLFRAQNSTIEGIKSIDIRLSSSLYLDNQTNAPITINYGEEGIDMWGNIDYRIVNLDYLWYTSFSKNSGQSGGDSYSVDYSLDWEGNIEAFQRISPSIIVDDGDDERISSGDTWFDVEEIGAENALFYSRWSHDRNGVPYVPNGIYTESNPPISSEGEFVIDWTNISEVQIIDGYRIVFVLKTPITPKGLLINTTEEIWCYDN